jgi:hypothetical protein
VSEYPSLIDLLCAAICIGSCVAGSILNSRWREREARSNRNWSEAATMLAKADKTHRTAREMMRIANERMNKAMRLNQGRDDKEAQS